MSLIGTPKQAANAKSKAGFGCVPVAGGSCRRVKSARPPGRFERPSSGVRALFTLILLADVVGGAMGCKKLKEDAEARKAEQEQQVTAEYKRLAFMVEGLDTIGDEPIDCRDDELDTKVKRSARSCTQLALTDEANLRVLFGSDERDKRAEQWSWMRTRSFDTLGTTEEIGPGTSLSQHRQALSSLETTHVGVFTTGSESLQRDPERYQGWLVIFDTKREELRCQVKLDLDVSKIFKPPRNSRDSKTSPKPHIDKFMRQVDKDLRSITKNFCTE